jgi:hypothetical protein
MLDSRPAIPPRFPSDEPVDARWHTLSNFAGMPIALPRRFVSMPYVGLRALSPAYVLVSLIGKRDLNFATRRLRRSAPVRGQVVRLSRRSQRGVVRGVRMRVQALLPGVGQKLLRGLT